MPDDGCESPRQATHRRSYPGKAFMSQFQRRLRRILDRHYLGRRFASKPYLLWHLRELNWVEFAALSGARQAAVLTMAMKHLGWYPYNTTTRCGVNSYARETPWGTAAVGQEPVAATAEG